MIEMAQSILNNDGWVNRDRMEVTISVRDVVSVIPANTGYTFSYKEEAIDE